ncbi:hypothetical protein L1049_022390 [Liquidambar formosana]|uniref:Uncharacterized protein n=1 Tax=Liquidambar formosana TaxID=63359 RepID=A0AAP0RE80_LIQFO
MDFLLQPVPAFPNSAKSTSPFDLNDETSQVQIPMFPNSVASLQGALPNMSATLGLLRTSGLGVHSPQLMPPLSPSYSSMMPPSILSFLIHLFKVGF